MTKGADSVLLPLLANSPENNDIKEQTLRHLSAFASEGLRTLVICQREIPEDFYMQWSRDYEYARISINNR